MAAVEQKKSYHVTKDFKGLNTKANRTAIQENEFAWIENVMPIGYKGYNILTPIMLTFGIQLLDLIHA